MYYIGYTIFMKRILLIIGTTAVIIVGIRIAQFYALKPIEPVILPPIVIEKEPKPITLSFVGDIMLARGVKNVINKYFNGDYSSFLQTPIIEQLATSDILFANLEGPISDRGRNVGSKFSFRFDPLIVPALRSAGFDIVSIANNHMGDWTKTAFEDTITHLRENGILFAGGGMTKQEATQPTIITLEETRIGFLGFTDVGPNWLAATNTSAGILLASDPEFETIIKQAKEKVDILIVSVHGGEEYKPHTDRQARIYHSAIDAGATMVVGHHPHVSQDYEWHNGGFIAYSLGNFIFDQYFSVETMQGDTLTITIENKKIKTTKVQTVYLNKKFQPERMELKKEEINPF